MQHLSIKNLIPVFIFKSMYCTYAPHTTTPTDSRAILPENKPIVKYINGITFMLHRLQVIEQLVIFLSTIILSN